MSTMAVKTRVVAPSRDTGSQKALRERNIGLVMSTLRAQGPRTQAGLARVTGLSTGTVSSIVRELESAGLVSTASAISSGRRSVEVSLAPDPRVVVGVDIGRTHMRMLGWDAGRVEAAMHGKDNQQVTLPKKIPVYIVYFTAFAHDGHLNFGNDLYDRDSKLVAEMHAAMMTPETKQAQDSLRAMAKS